MSNKSIKLLCVILFCFFLAACAGGAQEEENTLLEYPGVSWEATPEEVIQAMGFPAGEVLTETVEDGYNLGMENWDCFGQEAQRIVFHFEADEAGRDRLHAIEITYPEDGDMDAVRQAMEAEYGPGVTTYATSYILPAAAANADTEAQNVVVTEPVAANEGDLFWLSPSVTAYCSPEALEAAEDYVHQQQAQQGTPTLPEAELSAYWSAQYPVFARFSPSARRISINAYLLQYLQQWEAG
ncbi:MAG TPA: hypothetical protein IAB92_03185 [Candidatus Faecousia faecigallinarum]|nr:hypothetical protein [Candidatus Faecousia faecigallinarum]